MAHRLAKSGVLGIPLGRWLLSCVPILLALQAPVMASNSGLPALTLQSPSKSDVADDLVLEFETRSSRLPESEIHKLQRLADSLRDRPDSRLVIEVADPPSGSAHYFMRSRLAAVTKELDRLGVSYGVVKPAAEAVGISPIVLRMVPLAAPAMPVEILSAAEADSSTPAQGPKANDTGGAPVGSAPMSLLPAEKPAVPSPEAGSPALPMPAAAPSGQPPAESSQPAEPSPVAAPPSATASAAEAEEPWLAASGRSLSGVLKDWGDRAGWTIVWRSDRDYPLDASATFTGDFTSAATQLFQGFATATPMPLGHFYKGNRVLVVESGEGQ